MNWLDRIAAHFGYTRTIPAPEGGLFDMLLRLRTDYFAKVGQLHPGERDKLLALGMADKIARELEREVRSVIETGKMRANDKAHTERVANIGRYR
jgi:hypothetical protein